MAIATLEHSIKDLSKLLVLQKQIATACLLDVFICGWLRLLHNCVHSITIMEYNVAAVRPNNARVVWVQRFDDIYSSLGTANHIDLTC